MKPVNSFSKLTVLLLGFVVLTSLPAQGQKGQDLTVYESTEQMVAAAKQVITEITVEDFRNMYTRDDIYLIDVRSAEEHNEGAVPGANNIPRGVLEFRINDEDVWKSAGKNPPGKDDPVIVYCGTGARGALSAKALMQLGYKNVKSVEGGWGAFHEAYPDIKE